MKAIAGNGVCVYNKSKVKIQKKDGKLFCMLKGKRYFLDRKPTKNKMVTVILTRARKKSTYSKKKTNSRRKRLSKRRPRSVFKKHKSLGLKDCKKKLSNKIRFNIREGKFKSRKQAIAVSYSQIKKKYPECKKYFER
jgi:uncharacterized Zn finger protein (UPF0148 family)